MEHENLLGGPPAPTCLTTGRGASWRGVPTRSRLRRAHPACWRPGRRWPIAPWRPGETVTSYAYARTGYHRGLDQLRRAGWQGHGPVPWEHEPNQGFLRSLQCAGPGGRGASARTRRRNAAGPSCATPARRPLPSSGISDQRGPPATTAARQRSSISQPRRRATAPAVAPAVASRGARVARCRTRPWSSLGTREAGAGKGLVECRPSCWWARSGGTRARAKRPTCSATASTSWSGTRAATTPAIRWSSATRATRSTCCRRASSHPASSRSSATAWSSTPRSCWPRSRA